MKQFLEHYYIKYPNSTIQDYVKLIYQTVFGTGHMIQNPATSLNNIKDEILTLTNYQYEDLYEFIGYEYVRVNLRPYSNYKLSINTLNEDFNKTANVFLLDFINFDTEIQTLKRFLIDKGFDSKELKKFFNEYKKQGYPALHHSDSYRNCYKPAYRIIHKQFLTEELKFYQAIHFLEKFPKNKLSFISIDGRSGSGKTSLSALIKKEQNATVIPIDNFFDNANGEIGVNSQRVIDEIFHKVQMGKPLTYNRYDCKTHTFHQVNIEEVSSLIIIEGVYSANPILFDKYDGVIFLDIDEKRQIERLSLRSKILYQRFVDEWIPRENKYFEKFNLRFRANIIV